MSRRNRLVLLAVGIGLAYAVFMVMSAGPQSAPGTTAPIVRRSTPAERAASQAKKGPPKVNLAEARPQAGTDLVLGQPEITYCLAETYRVEAARTVVSGAADQERFDGLVKDLNSRCAKYRYKQSAYNAAKFDVENVRALLKRDGMARFKP